PVVAVLLAASPALAQTTGAIAGRIFDGTTRAPLARAAVTAAGSMGEWRTATDEAGEFRLSQLPPGDYTIDVQLGGYAAFTLEGFAVHAGQVLRLDRSMLAAGAAGTAETSRQRGVIAQETARIGGVIGREQMELIPYGRIQ